MLIHVRFSLVLILLMVLVSCGANNSHTAEAVVTDTSVQVLKDNPVATAAHERNQLTDSMLAEMINYYSKEYGADSIRMDISRSDTIVEVSFSDTGSYPDEYNAPLFVAYISLVKNINPILTGDVDGDGVNDMLVSVHTEGGGGGGNIWWSDHFLFLIKPNGENVLADVKSDSEIMNGSGYFFPKEIAGQVITGVGNAYAESDGHCCPSLYYRMHVALANGKMKTIDETAIPKPADFE